MQADEVRQEGSEPDPGRRTGPRHAAPKKPLFTRLQMPAGKAIALAAMPTAVLMGMGMTPSLAQAKPMPKNPFQDGPCVTQPDENPEDTQAQDADKADEKKDDEHEKAGAGTASPSPSASPGRSSAPDPTPSDGASATPSPSASSGGGLLGGLGDLLGAVLSPGQKESEQASPTLSPSPSGEDAGGTPRKTAKETAEPSGAAANEDRETTGPSPSPSPSASADKDDEADRAGKDDEGKKPFPCVVEKKSKGKDETTPQVLPNQPWFLDASSLFLQGLHYHGVVNLTTVNGETKQALKFTAERIDIGDMHQTLTGVDGKTYHVQAAKGSTSKMSGGTITLYTEELKGSLFGVIPITFDTEHPPPIDLPVAYFTNVKLRQAGQFGGNLTVPGLHNYITD